MATPAGPETGSGDGRGVRVLTREILQADLELVAAQSELDQLQDGPPTRPRPTRRRPRPGWSPRSTPSPGGRGPVPPDQGPRRPDSGRPGRPGRRRALPGGRQEEGRGAPGAARRPLGQDPADAGPAGRAPRPRTRGAGRRAQGQRAEGADGPAQRATGTAQHADPIGRGRRADPGVRPPGPGTGRVGARRGDPEPRSGRIRGPGPGRTVSPGVPGQGVEPARRQPPGRGDGRGAGGDAPGGPRPVHPGRIPGRAGGRPRGDPGPAPPEGPGRGPSAAPDPARRGRLSGRGELRARRDLDQFIQSLDHLRVAICSGSDAGAETGGAS